ncbi:hypothetical protein ASPZODRAFT_127676 [Penicilliopsis zonata CBS 506.65]|uniref:Uncharacterized protein n=1 Tax=Penicilliopsis zonata CBS 506.65 TaxID=1073090 RepID=A0A1L9SWV9_9EURO|nr:hypothetical protein ASPZODRAFT_127676 [Penicilliopsis zonata CBS 506.65]OJJ51581.1 hypothetical protein ASPZODRAFT_127676 [Penicilliopsis zonata CBS 506.65]
MLSDPSAPTRVARARARVRFLLPPCCLAALLPYCLRPPDPVTSPPLGLGRQILPFTPTSLFGIGIAPPPAFESNQPCRRHPQMGW